MKRPFLPRFATALYCVVVPLALAGVAIAPVNGQSKKPAKKAAPAPGKYGCTASRYNAATQSFEFTPKGSFTLSANKTYRYFGFSKPSAGRYNFNAASGKISFVGGYFDKGEATPIAGEKNRYHLVTPTLPDNRWTCSLTN